MRRDASAWLACLAAGEISSRELVERSLRRIEAENPRWNAIVAMRPDRALEEADAADVARRRGHDGPLLGVPITVKDSLDVAGMPTTCGTVARAGHRADRDATVVARARAAGAIILGKTNLPEYQWSYETDNALHGRTDNPLDPRRTSGGSSGGEAAAIAADLSPAGIGSDGGGSIRVPSAYCGIFGIRPTVGLTPETGVWPPTRATGMADLLCTGPLARSVRDLALLLGIMAGADGVDPYAVPVAVPLSDLDAVDCGALAVGWYVDDGVAFPSDATRAAVLSAAQALRRVGAHVKHTPAPREARRATALFYATMAADGGARARADLAAAGDRVHPRLKGLLAELADLGVSAAEYFEIRREVFALRAAMRALLDTVDVLLCPVVPGPAPQHGHRPGEAYGNLTSDAFNFVHAIALAGLPAVSVPAGLEDGMPVAVQVVARPFHDHVALAAARVLERVLSDAVACAPDMAARRS